MTHKSGYSKLPQLRTNCSCSYFWVSTFFPNDVHDLSRARKLWEDGSRDELELELELGEAEAEFPQ